MKPPILTQIYSGSPLKNTSVTHPIPSAASASANPGYIAMGAYRDLSIGYSLTGNAGGTATNVWLTVEASDDPVFTVFTDITKSGYDEGTNTMGNTMLTTAAGGVLTGILDFDQVGFSYVRVRLNTTVAGTNDAGACILWTRRAGSEV